MSRRAWRLVLLLLFAGTVASCAATPCSTPEAPVPVGPNARCGRDANSQPRVPERAHRDGGVCDDLVEVDPGWEALRRTRGDALVLRYTATFSDLDEVVARAAAVEGVLAAEPFVVFETSLFSHKRMLAIPVQGRGATSLVRAAPYVVEGSLAELSGQASPHAIGLGREIAAMLGVQVGDELGIWPVPVPDLVGTAAETKLVRVRVAAILAFPGGDAMGLNANEVVMGLSNAVALWEAAAGQASGPTGAVLFYRDGADGAAATKRVEQALVDGPYRVISQDDLNKGLRESVRMLRTWCAGER